MIRFLRHAFPAVIAAGVLIALSSCQAPDVAPAPSVSVSVAPPSATVASSGAADHVFTVRYSASQTLNPITATNPNNTVLAPLMYEGLFVLNSKLTAEPVLCESFTTQDGLSYTFKLRPGIAMSDGSTLTAADVRYTLTQAKQTGRFTGRLKILDTVTAVDALTVRVTLKYANYMFPQLLDIPVIKSNSIDQNHPAGTGPYYYSGSGTPRLTALPTYRMTVPTPVIYLKDDTDAQLSVDFSSHVVDFFWDDPMDDYEIRILSDHETRFYSTTILEYIGFNTRNTVLADPELRRALGLAVDRGKIIKTVSSNHAVAAPLILSPSYRLYDPKWEPKITDTLGEMSAILHTIGADPDGMQDHDGDGFLEMKQANGNWTRISLTFIVNSENRFKVQVAQLITDALRADGIDVTLVTHPWEDYVTALQKGRFDIYLGEVSVPADYDLSALLSPGGALDYGKAGSAGYVSHINAFMGASKDASQQSAAKALCDYVWLNAPIVPILYREFAVHSNRNVIVGLNPTQSNLFYGLAGWKLNLG